MRVNLALELGTHEMETYLVQFWEKKIIAEVARSSGDTGGQGRTYIVLPPYSVLPVLIRQKTIQMMMKIFV